MKKIALALTLLAFTGSSASDGSILVNTVSFADMPDKTNAVAGKEKNKLNKTVAVPATACKAAVKLATFPVNNCPVKRTCTSAAKPTISLVKSTK